MLKASLTKSAVVITAAGALGMLGISAPAAMATVHRTALRPAPQAVHQGATFVRAKLPAGERYLCPAPTRAGQMTCMSIIRTAKMTPAIGALRNGPYGPGDLRSAYKIARAAARIGKGRTVAIVDAFSDPKAAADLAVYRSHFRLGACTIANGCLHIVNEFGRVSPLPKANANWAGEESLDLDMVSAICPKCHILLVEARGASTADLGVAENTAVARGSKYVSNSWSGGEFLGQDFYDHYFNHPGVAIDFASGDSGYATAYPTDLQYVTAIGGTTLKHAANRRGWAETVWGPGPVSAPEGTASGCSTLEAKASWQRADARTPGGCLNRTENDVAAVANPNTGVSVYDSYQVPVRARWGEFGGTSAATPIITAIYALAGVPTKGTYPAEYPYLHAGHLFDVTAGLNGACELVRKYLCHGVRGYDGPTGLGTPNGTGAFTDGPAHRVTLIDPGTVDQAASTAFSLRINGLDTRRVTALSYSATGLPAGLSIHPIANSTSARITGTLPTPGTFHVTVVARDGLVSGSARFAIVSVPSLAAAPAQTGLVSIGGVSGFGGQACLDDNGGTAGQNVLVQTCNGASAHQQWTYQSAGGPNDIGTLQIAGLCLGRSGSGGVLATCTGAAGEHWQYLGFGVLRNMSGGCLAAGSAGAQVRVAGCNFTSSQAWSLPAGPMVAGAGALCLDDLGDGSPSGTQVDIATCGSGSGMEQQWFLNGDGSISSGSGLCLTNNFSTFAGTAVTIAACDNTSTNFDPSEWWLPGPGGQLINLWSGMCLSDPGNGGAGTKLTEQDCYGNAGEIWGLS